MTEKAQFDSSLGGSEFLPSKANVLKLVSARANEIAAMTYSIDNPQQTKRVFQKLPVHMRRRVMSHNSKRMPRRLREIHIRQMAQSGLPPKIKRPTRKYRRRPQNLIAEYKRRQANKIWLETHIWHAKRFKMIDKWGYRIPDRSNNRCFRASYRAVAKHCLIQDISYYSCVELSGPADFLHKTLNRHCDPGGLSFAAKSFAQGNREGSLMFFEKNGYPERPIGVVNFIWKFSSSDVKTIWIWVHASFYHDVLSQICTSFEFELESLSSYSSSRESPCPEYANADNKCRIVLLRNSLNRFRIHGPLSLALLTDAMRLPELEQSLDQRGRGVKKSRTESDSEMDSLREDIEDEVKMEVTEGEDAEEERAAIGAAQKTWEFNYYKDTENARSFKVQKDIFELLKDLKSPSQLPPSVVMAFTVLDPRFVVPKRRTKARTNANDFQTMPVPPTLANISPIWNAETRASSTENFMTMNDINELRSQNLVPGVYNDSEYNQNRIAKLPVLFIQRPGSRCKEKSIGFSSGMDIILPSGWANPFWISFIFRCAKPGGLRESKSIILESLALNSADFNPPDTAAYTKEAVERKYELLERYFRLPPNRRPNYVKLGISSPFYCEWNLLVKEWSGLNNFYVLRDQKALGYLKESISSFERPRNFAFDKTLFKDPNCLITVKVCIQNRGCPRDFSIVSLPSHEDLDKYKKDLHWGGPVAKMVKDSNESERQKLRRGHLALLKRLRRQRLRLRDKVNNTQSLVQQSAVDAETAKKNLRKKAQSVVDLQAEKMRNLYLPKPQTVRYSCNREVMGYVVKGDFSFTEAKGVGLGYVALTSLFELIERKTDVVLVRNTKSRQYRLARLSILL